MKQCPDRSFLFRVTIGSALIGGSVLSGCASATIEDAVPTAAAQLNTTSQTVSEPVETALSSGGPKDTGSYPNLNIKPQAANQQITPEERTSSIEAMQAAQSAQAARSADTTTDPAVLRKLAETHAEDALKAIEAQE